jgi:hypothetical protein
MTLIRSHERAIVNIFFVVAEEQATLDFERTRRSHILVGFFALNKGHTLYALTRLPLSIVPSLHLIALEDINLQLGQDLAYFSMYYWIIDEAQRILFRYDHKAGIVNAKAVERLDRTQRIQIHAVDYYAFA